MGEEENIELISKQLIEKICACGCGWRFKVLPGKEQNYASIEHAGGGSEFWINKDIHGTMFFKGSAKGCKKKA